MSRVTTGRLSKHDPRKRHMRGGGRVAREVLSTGVLGARHSMGQITQATRVANELRAIAVHNQGKFGVLGGGMRSENFVVRQNDLLAVCHKDLGIACLETRMYGTANGMDSHGPGLTITPSACGVYIEAVHTAFKRLAQRSTDLDTTRVAEELTRVLLPFFVRPAGIANLGEKSQGKMMIRTVATTLGGTRTVINGYKDDIQPLDQLVWAVRLEGETRVALPGDHDDRENFFLKPLRRVHGDLDAFKRAHPGVLDEVFSGIKLDNVAKALRPVATALQGAASGEQFDANLHI